jgi:peptide-methionine (S)-S-oxide reductase
MSEIMTVAGGCFWGVEAAFRQIPGVLKTTAGYTGGTAVDPSYEQVCTGTTGHAESVQVEFDPKKITYKELLGHFWQMHDPTQMNRQGPDVGTQYRSAIFYHNPEQQKAAEASKQALVDSGRFKQPIVNEIVAAGPFYDAEGYHQQYLEKRGMATCTPELTKSL